ncbi:MAG: hypothetical protein ABIH82_03540 [Candidatus Woesearchaeota archaeon]
MPIGSVFNWRKKGKTPPIIQENLTSWHPNTEEQSILFSYVLGMFARQARGKINKRDLRREPACFQSKIRIADRLQRLTGLDPNFDNKILLYDSKLMGGLVHAFSVDTYREFLRNDSHRLLFLQGLFDVSQTDLYKNKNGTIGNRFNVGNPLSFEMLILSMFELGIYANFHEGANTQVNITHGVNLTKLDYLELIIDPLKLEKIRGSNLQRKFYGVPEQYFAIRKSILDGTKGWKELEDGLGVPMASAKEWCGDIFGWVSNGSTPFNVRNYLAICARFNLPNVYEAEEPVQRHEKWFFPVGVQTYCLPIETQERYLRLVGGDIFTEDDANRIWNNLSGQSKKKTFDFSFNGSTIDGMTFSRDSYVPFKLRVGELSFTITPKAIVRYFATAGLEPEDLTQEHIQDIRDNVKAHLNGGSPDYEINLEDGVVTSMGLINSSAGGKKISAKFCWI